MAYLQPADYPNYGLPAGTTADWITAATALINSYCRRPDLNVIQYTERLRLTAGSQTVLLSYLPLIPDWSLGYSGTIGSGSAQLPAYIVTEDLIEYHWLGDPTPRVFQLGLPNSMAYQYVAIKFGAPVVKGAGFAHCEVLVTGR